jgi:hypothetical protein
MNLLQYSRIAAVVMLSLATLSAGAGGQQRLIMEEVKKLKELNRLILSSVADPEQFNGKKVYIKIRILPSDGKQLRFKVEKVSLSKLTPAKTAGGGEVVISGRVVKNSRNRYEVDLSGVLPPPDDRKTGKVPDRKEERNGKRGEKDDKDDTSK